MLINKTITAEIKKLSERIDSLEKFVNEVGDKANQLSKDVVINARYNNDQKDIKRTFGDIDKVINNERVTTKVFYVSVIFVSIIFFLFGFVVGDSFFLKFGGEVKTTVTTTETTTSVKPNKNTVR
jgi:t-SNARE complex subunit (syntaxin)